MAKEAKDPAAQELGRRGGAAVRKRGHAHFVAIGAQGGAATRAAWADARRYRELRDLGLLPSEAAIDRARRRARRGPP